MDLVPLPIDAVIAPLMEALRTASCAILKAPAGAGKTTRVPAALIDCGVSASGSVLVLQPRRVAARAVARRIADERHGQVGDEVGYHVRFDRQCSRQTRLIIMTEGILIRRLQDDPFLDGVAAVVLDEFHERHLETDLSLAMVRRIQQTVRPDLKLLVMSATLAAEPISQYLDGCPIIESDGATYPVQIRYQESGGLMSPAQQVARVVEPLLAETRGDILVFLPGAREIRQTQDELQHRVSGDSIRILPLYGDLTAAEQDQVFAPTNERKIVLATNVAETSITIPGITAVIDTGTARIMEFSSNLGLNRLELQPISRAAADQRAGRAGRTAPGICLRLWSETAHRHRPERETAEIHRVDLSGVLLQLLNWGESDFTSFPWFEPPDPGSIQHAETLLLRLGATDRAGITPLGRLMVQFPVAPRIARLLIDAARSGQSAKGALAAALLSERDPFQRGDRASPARHRSRSDLLDRVDALMEYSRSRRTQFDLGTLHRGAAESLLKAADQLQRQTRDLIPASETTPFRDHDEGLLRAVLAAFPDRVARRREPNGRRGLMVGGRGIRLSDQSAVSEGELFVCLDADASGTDALVRLASLVERDWLTGDNLDIRVEVEFEPTQQRVQARRRVCWEGLILEESPAALPDEMQVAEVLAEAARDHWDRVRPGDGSDASQFLARVHSLARWMPDLQLPTIDDEFLKDLLPELCMGRRSLAELQQAHWLDLIRSKLSSLHLQQIEREAPEKLQVPSGSRVGLQYEPDRPPILAVRIQEVFGWQSTPRIAGGRVSVLLHLLAPNHRPQQITDDLASFWKNGYPIVRGELRRRYPRHAWPEDPWNAVAERRPKPKPH
jgi:ATP-dependent helicase HrpB